MLRQSHGPGGRQYGPFHDEKAYFRKNFMYNTGAGPYTEKRRVVGPFFEGDPSIHSHASNYRHVGAQGNQYIVDEYGDEYYEPPVMMS